MIKKLIKNSKKKNNKKSKLNNKIIMLSIIMVLLLGISVGYAAISTILNIEGVAAVQSISWSIVFENLGSATLVGDAEEITAPTIDSEETTIGTYDVGFNNPGDSISYTFDVVNDGTLNAVLADINISVPTCAGSGSNAINDANNVCSHLNYTLTYADGTSLKEDDTLNAGTSRKMKLTLSYDDSIGVTLPSDDVSISNLDVELVYSQASMN